MLLARPHGKVWSQHGMLRLLLCSTYQLYIGTPFTAAILTSKNAPQECSCLSVLKCPRWSIWCLRLHLVQFTLPSSFLRSTHNRHPIMITSCDGNAFHITGRLSVIGGFPYKRPVMRRFNVFLGVGLNELLNKESNYWWIETQRRSCNITYAHTRHPISCPTQTGMWLFWG